MKTLFTILALTLFVSCESGNETKKWVEECAGQQVAGHTCEEPPVVEPPVVEPPIVEPPVIQISMDNIQAVWFDGVEVEFFNAEAQGNDFYTEFKRFDADGELRLSFFDSGTVYVNKWNGAGQHTLSNIHTWEIRDNKLFINNAEHGITL